MLRYRSDIDGLRAVAIALVLAYHIAPATFPGGFVGVDVFFVISGFLITKILAGEPGRLGRFYARRVRRLAPALLVVLVVTLLLGRLVLLEEGFRQLGKHTAAAALFIANIVLWMESGYFDAAAIDKPLLHLWSLGIEEQFYFLWPVTLWWLLRRPGRALWATTLLAVASFAACVAVVRAAPDSAYFLPWYRMWEPLVGAGLALSLGERSVAVSPRRAEWFAWSGAALVVASAFVLGHGRPFPSWGALAPVGGTAILIAVGERTHLGRSVLSWKPVVGLGRISYPLYLWHWPLISLLADSHPTAGVGSRAVLCLVAGVLATGTYLFLELPSRTGYRRRPRAMVAGLSAGMILLTLVSVGLTRAPAASRIVAPSPFLVASPEVDLLNRGFKRHFEILEDLGTRECGELDGLPEDYEFVCRIAGPTPLDGPLLIWGDSTADSWSPLVMTVARERGAGAVVLSFSACPPLVGVRGPQQPECDLEDAEWKARLIERLRPSHIVLTARWAAYIDPAFGEVRPDSHFVTMEPEGPADRRSSRRAVATKLPETIARLTRVAPVTVVASAPDLLYRVERALRLGLEYRPSRADHREAQRPVAELLAKLAADEPRLTILDPADLLCGPELCTGVVGDTLVYQDDNHVTAQGALLFRERLLAAMDRGRLPPTEPAGAEPP